MPTIVFTHRYKWGSAGNNSSNRPQSAVEVKGPLGRMNLWALMDSGADYPQFEKAVANTLGISLRGARQFTVQGATGVTTMDLVSGVSVCIEGTWVVVDCLFGGVGRAVIGRTGILAATEFGMDGKGWLYV